jgi:hypothetical protein
VVEHDTVVVVHDLRLVAEFGWFAEAALGDRAGVTAAGPQGVVGVTPRGISRAAASDRDESETPKPRP